YAYLQAAQCLKLEALLDAAGVSYVSFGKLEYCCGTFGFYRGRDDMADIKRRLVDMVEAVQPKRILTNCGHCFNAMADLVTTLPGDGAPVVRHAAQEFLELIVAGRLDVAHLERTFAVHDSCNFRELHDSHGPLRSLLRRMGTVHEMLSHGRGGKCCGDVSRYYAPGHIDADNRAGKVREFVSSGADQMVMVCAGCYEHFHAAPQLRAVDLIDLVYEGYGRARLEDLAAKPQVRHHWENMSPVLDEEGE
ncbi:MAG: (Fe-S)-binding protein, partial [Deferrisomatales bacterium]|nr:(Fe-S)-binding protein [Deferrisomatales bacterium]